MAVDNVTAESIASDYSNIVVTLNSSTVNIEILDYDAATMIFKPAKQTGRIGCTSLCRRINVQVADGLAVAVKYALELSCTSLADGSPQLVFEVNICAKLNGPTSEVDALFIDIICKLKELCNSG